MNKNGYIPHEQRKKILLITDDIRMPSGVGTVGKEIVIGTAHRYNWAVIGGAINHPDLGKRFILDQDTNINAGIEDSSVVLYPSNGYGDPSVLRTIIKMENPDAIFLITDPRYFIWLFNMENEIRTKIPIVYLNIWDDLPAPLWNKPFYESCDALLGISKQTVNINKLVLGDEAKNKIIDYVPHGLNSEIFRPLDETETQSKSFIEFKNRIFKNKDYEFVVFFNSRNIRRKQIPDTILAFKVFYNSLPADKAKKCALLLHTELVSEHGTDLDAILKDLAPELRSNVIVTNSKFNSTEMNYLYNMSDVQILLTSNEGWGLSLTEALLTGLPIIGNVTGGIQDQMRFEDESGNWIEFNADFPSNHRGTYLKCGKWAFPVFPRSLSIQGSPPTPYIFDDRCSWEDAASKISVVYNIPKEQRKELGLKGREWAISDEAGFTQQHQAQRIIKNLDKLFDTWEPRAKYELINATKYSRPTLNHKLIY